MKSLRIFFLTAVLLLISAGLVMAVTTPASLKVTNTTSKSIQVKLDVDGGSGSSEVTLSPGASHTFNFENTAWYEKKVTHRNKIFIYYDGKLAKTYEMNLENSLDLLGDKLLWSNSFKQLSSPMKCSVVTTTGTDIYDFEAYDTMDVTICE